MTPSSETMPTSWRSAGRQPRSYVPRKSEQSAAATIDDLHTKLTPAETEVLSLCDGRNTLAKIAEEIASDRILSAEECADVRLSVSKIIHRLFRAGLLETIEQSALRDILEFHGSRLRDLKIEDICTGDFFTAVLLNDGSQGVAINFNNVSGPHRTPFNHAHYDVLLKRLLSNDPLLLESFLRQPELDCLGQSVRLAVLNALSRQMMNDERLGAAHGIELHDGYLDLASFFRPGDSVAMIGCTGNYSCRAVGGLADLGTIYFSDFEYVEPFKQGIIDCIQQNFLHPAKVVLSAGQDNETICRKADVVVVISDTLCTNTLDELLIWSSNAREVLITGRSYAADPIHLFQRGASGITTHRVTKSDFIGFIREKIQQGEFGFTDRLVPCFQRMFAVPQPTL